MDLGKLRAWKESILEKLGAGVATLAKMRGVQVIQGRGYFEGSQTLRVETGQGQQFIQFEQALLAVGSLAAMPKAFDLGNPRVMTSTEALEIEDIPENLLVVGGGYIGMEMGTVYAGLGSKIVLVEALDGVLLGADPDLARPVVANAKRAFKEIRLKARVTKMATVGKQIKVELEYNGQKLSEFYDRVLVAMGRVPNSAGLGLENTKVELDEKGFVKVNERQQTNDPGIYAIGDIAGGILLAHKANKEAHIAVESINGGNSVPLSGIVIPAVVFTDPELAVVRPDRSRGERTRRQIRGREISLGGVGTRVVLRPDGRGDEDAHRSGNGARAGGWNCGRRRGRVDCRGGAGD